MTFQLIDQERAHHAVSRLCSVLNVSRQGYWAWKQRPPSRRRLEDERLKPRILEAWKQSDRIYGAPRLHAELRLTHGLRLGQKRVARLMRELGIQGVSRRRGRVRTTTPNKRAAPGARPREARLHRRATGRDLGGRHHLRADLRGLALPGGGDGSLLAHDRRPVDARRSRGASCRRRDLRSEE